MSRILIFNLVIGIVIALFNLSYRAMAQPSEIWAIEEAATAKAKPELIAPLNKIFHHERHRTVIENMNILCGDCHHFSIKGQNTGSLPANVKEKLLKSPRQVCHQCHLGRIAMPSQSQCILCHKNVANLVPADHRLSWKSRHGRMAQMDRDACAKCHSQKQCSECHIKRDLFRHRVHTGNFRMFHSIEARANPRSCVTCHHSWQFCSDCHRGKK
jgi:hypothetical protein